MKKFARVLALMLVASMLCVMLVACGSKPAAEPEDAEAALKDNGYTVVLLDSKLAMAAASVAIDGDLEAYLTAFKGDDYLYIAWFEDEDEAQSYYDELDEKYEESKAELEEIEDEDRKAEYEEMLDKAAYGISGNMVWMGTKDAVKAAK